MGKEDCNTEWGNSRKNGNTSSGRKFTEGAESEGNVNCKFFLDHAWKSMVIKAVLAVSSHRCPCVQRRDDMSQIYPASKKECDVIILATPLYYWNMSRQIRQQIDKDCCARKH